MKSLSKQYITFEISKLLKDIDFPTQQYCNMVYLDECYKDGLHYVTPVNIDTDFSKVYPYLTISEVIDYIGDKYGIFICDEVTTTFAFKSHVAFGCIIYGKSDGVYFKIKKSAESYFSNKKDAQLSAIKDTIDIIKDFDFVCEK